MRRLVTVGLLLLCSGPASAQGYLDLVPVDASVAIIVRNPNELRKKGDEFLQETQITFGLRPTEALDAIVNFLGLRNGLDLNQPAGVVLLRPEDAKNAVGLGDLEESLYGVFAFTDLDEMAGNFGFAKGDLKLDQITKVKLANPPFGRYVLARGKHIYLAMKEAPLARLRKAPTVGADLSKERRRTFDATDVVVHLSTRAMDQDWLALIKTIETEFDKVDDPQEKKQVAGFLKALESLRYGLIGVRVDQGLALHFLTAFPKERNDEVQEFLKTFRTQGEASLKGLPEGRVVAAQTYVGAGGKNALFARVFFNFLLKNLLETKQITSALDRPAFVGVFSEVWQRLEGSRIAAYLTQDESKRGLFSLVAILDAQDAQKFLGEMRTLARIADGTLDPVKQGEGAIDIPALIKDLSDNKYAVRASATTRLRLIGEPALAHLAKVLLDPPDLETSRRAQLLHKEISAVAAQRRKELLASDLPRYVRPTFAWVAKAETRAGLPVDIVHIKLSERDQPAAKQMQQFFGPEWDRMRLTVIGRQVIVLLGSEVELLDAALTNVKEGRAGLAASKVLGKMPASGATASFHLSVETLVGLVTAQQRPVVPARLTSFALTVQESGLQVDLFVPTADVKVMGKERLR